MAGLFDTPFSTNTSFREGFITFVDPHRFTCSVRTLAGQPLLNVSWLIPSGGSGTDGVHMAPNVGDKVLLCMTTSSPIIMGCIPRAGSPDTLETSISNSSIDTDIGGSSNLKNGMSLNPNRPSDFLPGDKVFTSKGGSLLALLASGGIILKSSHLSQIFLSKFNGLVRIVSRNFHRYADSSSEVSSNLKGALYRWFGADWDLSRNTNNSERYNEVVGHVTAGKTLRGEPSSESIIPGRDSRVREHWLNDSSGNEIMVESLYENGKLILIVKQPSGSSTTTTQDTSLWKSEVLSGGVSSTIIISPSSIDINYNGDSRVVLSSASVNATHGSHGVLINSSGTHLS